MEGHRQGGKLHLYDLSQDVGEKHDLSEQFPDIAARLKGYTDVAYREPRSQKDDGKYTGKSR